MPTSAHSDDEIEEVYSDLEEVLKFVKGNENLIILGDWNAVIGEEEERGITGKYGLGTRNERDNRLIEFCNSNKLTIANTLFKNHKRRRYTWKMPGDIGRYQIDYIMVRQRFKNQVKDCRSYPGPDIGSDHNLVMMKYNLKFKKIEKAKRKTRRWDIASLKDTKVQEEFQNKVKRQLEKIEETEKHITKEAALDVEKEWNNIKKSLTNATTEVIRHKETEIRNPWITKEIIELLEERRKYKSKTDEEGERKYKMLKWEIIRKCRKAKEEWLENRCTEIEEKIKMGKTDAAFILIKKYFNKTGPKARNIRNKEGNLLIESVQKADRWKEYIECLYGDEEMEDIMEKEESIVEDNLGDCILRSEFDAAMNDLKNNKAPGIDGLQAEMLKNAGEEAKDRLFKLICRIYETGNLPKDFKRNIILTIPKKSGADKCENYRTISLTSHASKILTRIVQRRMEHRAEENLDEDQFGFRRNRGTREAILALRLIIEREIKKDKTVYLGFVDLEKAFDNVSWRKMFMVLKTIGIKYRERRVIHNLYKEQVAVVRMEEEEREAKVRKGVRQGCSISPLIFNLYVEEAINKVKDKGDWGINVQGRKIKMLRFADDIAIIASNKSELEEALKELEKVLAGEYGMRINKKKTKVLVCRGKERKTKTKILIGSEEIEEVKEFCYLGSQISRDGRSQEDIKRRLAQGRNAFNQKKQLLCAKKLNLETRKKFLKTYVWSTALFGCETWTIGEADKKKIEAFEMWCYRRMLKIKWTDKIKNEEVLSQIAEERNLWKTIQKRRDRFVGHLLRHDSLVRDVLEAETGKVRKQGRPRLEYCSQIVKDVGCSKFSEIRRLAQDRKAWRYASNQSSD